MHKRKPIFIGGTGRCGTSILSAMMQESNNLMQLLEPEGLHSLFLTWCHNRYIPFNIFKKRYVNHISDRLKYSVTPYNTIYIEKINEYFSVAKINSAMNIFSGCWSTNSYKKNFDEFLDEVVGNFSRACNRSHWFIKQPGYIYMHIDKIFALHPEMRFIHIVRDGRDVIASMMSQPWWQGKNRNQKFNLAVNLWRKTLNTGIQKEHLIPQNNLLTIQFEELVENCDKTIKNIFDFIEVVPSFSYDYFGNSLEHRGNNFDSKKTNIGTYKHKLNSHEIHHIETTYRTLLNNFYIYKK